MGRFYLAAAFAIAAIVPAAAADLRYPAKPVQRTAVELQPVYESPCPPDPHVQCIYTIVGVDPIAVTVTTKKRHYYIDD